MPAIPKAEIPAGPAVAPERIVLTAVQITGATVYGAERFSPLYEGLLGREIAAADVEKLLEAITKLYRDDGYFLSRAIAQPQSGALGILTINVIEGYVDRVTMAGAQVPDGAGILAAMAEKITASRPLRLDILERYILLMNDIAGVALGANLRPSASDAAAHELVVTFTYDAFNGFASLDNRGTALVGPLQLYAGVGANGLLGGLEETRFSFLTVPDSPEELTYFELFHEHAVGPEGTRVFASVARSSVDTGPPQRFPEVESEGTRLVAGASHPFLRSRDLSFYAQGRFDYFDANNDKVGSQFSDRVRVLRGGVNLLFTDGFDGANRLLVEVSQGIDVLDSSRSGSTDLSRAGGRSDFTKFNGYYRRYQPIAAVWGIEFQAAGQYAPDTLLSSEEFALGGRRFGRGFEPAELTGSDGVGASVELRRGVELGDLIVKHLDAYAFYDVGVVWQDGGNERSLSSAGIGIRAGFSDRFSGALELAKPLSRAPAETGDKDPRLFFHLLALF